jgi:hypothetical protein
MRGKPLTFTLYIGDKQVDTLPEDYLERMCERLSERMSLYYSNHPEKYLKFTDTERKEK